MLDVVARTVARAWRLDKGRLVLAGVLTVLGGALPSLVAYFGSVAINQLTNAVAGRPYDMKWLYGALVAAVVVGFINQAASEVGRDVEDAVGEAIELDTTKQLNHQHVELDLAQIDGPEYQRLMAKSGSRHSFASRRLCFAAFRVIGTLTGVVTSGAIIMQANPWFILPLVVAVIPGAIVGVRRSRAYDTFWDMQGHGRRVANSVEYMFRDSESSMELRLNDSAPFLLQICYRLNAAHNHKLRAMRARYTRFDLVFGWLTDLIRLILELTLVSRVITGSLSLGNYTFYASSFSRFTSSVSRQIGDVTSLYEDILVMHDVYAIIDMRPKIISRPGARKLGSDSVPRIEFRDVTFTYPGAGQPVFRNLSFVIEPTQNVALVGENGAGKSTLIKLLARMYDPDSGVILIDDTDLRDLNLAAWRSRLGVLLQSFNQYPLSVRDNIEIGRAGAKNKRSRLQRAIDQADARKLITGLKAGLEQKLTRTYDEGAQLSGGQWQRLALARAFYRDAGVLVLDEPTAAVDAQAEATIFNELMMHQADKTTLIVSHRFSTVRRADLIFVLKDGQIIERGSHAELMRIADGLYREMFELQAEGYR